MEEEKRLTNEKGILQRWRETVRETEKESARECSSMQPTARLAAAASPHLCTSTHAISISAVLRSRAPHLLSCSLLFGTCAHQERSAGAVPVPGAAALVSAIFGEASALRWWWYWWCSDGSSGGGDDGGDGGGGELT